MFKAFANIGRIPELRRKFAITLGLLAICRFGVYIPLPGVDTVKIAEFMRQAEAGAFGRLMVLADIFSGGAMNKGAILALGIMPYISASIIFQVLMPVVPALERIAREGESGRKRISQYTRYATVILCIVQSLMITGMLQRNDLVAGTYWRFAVTATIAMTAGTLFLMWMGEQIDEFGLGNGVSLIIMMNILSRMPSAMRKLASSVTMNLGGEQGKPIGPERLALLIGLFVFMIVAVVLVTQAQRRVPMNHARRTREGFSHRSYLPLRVNMSGVIAIIFAQSVMMLPNFLKELKYVGGFFNYFVPWKFFYVMLYMGLIVFFSYFYTAITFNPVEKANEFKQYGAFIPGIRPGRRTAAYLERIMNRITLAGAAFVAVIAVAPQIMSSNLKVDAVVASFFGGTSLLITVGVALDLVQRIESYMMMQAYEGFMKGGRIRGRRG
ncbi:MAG: preprotein translocase subunit SecY [Planctomycetota bacterium]|jgi:preprotein translocase subunit SecY